MDNECRYCSATALENQALRKEVEELREEIRRLKRLIVRAYRATVQLDVWMARKISGLDTQLKAGDMPRGTWSLTRGRLEGLIRVHGGVRRIRSLLEDVVG